MLILSPAAPSAGSPGNVARTTLSNGLRVVVVRNPLAPVVTVVMNYRAGSDEAPEGFPGMAHAQEHMMFRGSPSLSADQLANIAADMGGRFNADTQQAVTQYFFTVPKPDLDVALHIEAIRMSSVLDTGSLWEQERGAIEQEVARDLSNPEYVFYTRLLAAMFRGTPYAHDALGTRPSFERTTGEMLQKFHKTWYAPNNATLVIAGDVDPSKTLAAIRDLFGGIPARKLPPHPEIKLQPVKPETLRLDTDLPYGLAVTAFRWPGSGSRDFAAAQILADVLGSHRGDLYALVPQGHALDAGFSLSTLPRAGLGYAVAALPRGADADAVLAQVHKILRQEAHGVPPDLIAAAKRREVASAEFQKDSIPGLAMLWSDALAVEGRQSPDDDIRAIERVSVADVNRVARLYLDEDHAISAILTPASSGKPVSSAAYGGKESFAPKESKPVELPKWAALAATRLTVPASDVHPTVTTLRNGLELIVQPESVGDAVSVFGHIRNNPDLETPAGEEGVDRLLDRMLEYGTKSLDRTAFLKALDDIGASESAGTDFSLEVLSGSFGRGVELLADNQLHPALPKADFEVIRSEMAAAVAGELQSPGYLRRHALDAALFPAHDPTLRHPTSETISKLTLEDVSKYRSKVFRPDLTTIVVIGHTTPEEARQVIQRYFGAWSAEGPKPETELPAVAPNKPATLTVPNSSRVQDSVTLAETVSLTRSDPDYYALNLGNHVLSGAFYATRLDRDLREKAGLVYTVNSALDAGRSRAMFAASYGCDPENVSKARALIERDLEEMRSHPVPDDELLRAKVLLLRQIPISESSVQSIAQGLIFRTTQRLPLDEPTVAAHRYIELTAAQVEKAFATWIRPDGLVQVTEGPTPK